MYCPSCDKSYGAVHSRCPECHSWLKVSAPSGGRKSAKTGTAAAASPPAPPAREQSSVSTMDRSDDEVNSSFGGDDNGGWADPAPSSPSSNWGGGDDDWNSGGLGGGAGAASSSEGWGGNAAAPPQAGAGSSWSGKESSDSYGWGGEPASPSSSNPMPATPARANNGGWADSGTQDGWGGSSGGSRGPAPAEEQQDGWLGGGGGHDPGPRAGASSSAGSGWLANSGGEDTQASPGRGWLGDGPSNDAPRQQSGGGGGWLGDSSDAGGPSMTEMVDHAISVEEADDFVDDSWVDEEIRDNEFDDLEIPEYAPPAPEVGGAFLKMLLVAVLFLLVGGGIMFAQNDSKSPEETAQEETVKQLEFGRATAAGGKKDLEAGKPGLAVPQFEQALVALSDGKAPQDEIYETEVLLGRALMADGEHKEAYKHWLSLKESGQEKYKAEAQTGIDETSRQLRIVANGHLDEAKKYAAKNEITSVKRLGRDALDLYEDYGGSRAQMGDAHGVIGRGHLNGREYAQAKDELKQAVALAPSLGYQKYLNQASQALAPAQYVPPIQTQTYQRPARPSSGGSKPSFTLGQPQYQKSSGGRRGGGRRTSNSGNGGGNAAPAPAAPAKSMKEIPIYRPTQRSGSSGERKGSKGVLKTY